MKKGSHLSENHKRKLSEAKKGKQAGNQSPHYGKHRSDETKKKISEAKKGKLLGANNPHYGKHHSEETKKKLSEKNKGKYLSEETKKKISEAQKGKKRYQCSDGTRKKMSEAHKGVQLSEETKQKMSESRKGNKNPSWKGGEVKIFCKFCGKEKLVKPSHIKKGNGKFCSLKCSCIWTLKHQKKHITDIEHLIEKELIKRDIPYTKQVPLLGITLVDFLLPKDTVIYADGDYWHSKKKVKDRDIEQDFKLTFYGYKVFRFTGVEIKNSAKKCIDKIKFNK